ncbi:GAF and ANTAR domain-containing protein [Sciscionella marina]|uniref:GAF and ANTAR domain-containing protein n=1 Tax=Sciscionella marina TaxID=508770 RepID=UPI00037AD698|nr:GAF and ANTAR domain-containing protein [Sciscionella marina]
MGTQSAEEPVPAEVGDQLVTALAAAARELGERPGSEDDMLRSIVSAAVATVPGAEHAGVSLLHSDGAIISYTPSSSTVAEVDQLQSTYREGPCVTALWDEHTVLVDDLVAEADRWPRFAPEAAACGVASMLSFQLFTREDTLGALNLYSSVREGFDAESQTLGGLFASHAALVLAGAQESASLHRALATRDVIGQAKGILIERFDVDAETAFSMLVHSSQTTNLKLVDVASWLAQGRDRRRSS